MTVEITNFNPPAPGDVSQFQRELELACRDRSIEFRIVWGVEPDKVVAVIDGNTYVKKKYPHPHRVVEKVTLGNYIVRCGKVVGYETPAGILVSGSPIGVRLAHVSYEERAIDRWVIEQKLRDDVAREQHADSRYFRYGNRIIDRGEFPKEGIWTWFHQIEKHDSPEHEDTGFCRRCPCCRRFDDLGKICLGGYREPDGRDLEFIKACLADRDEFAVLRHPAEPPTAHEIRREAQRMRQKMEESEQKRAELEDQELGEEIEALLRLKYIPKFDMGAARLRAAQLKTGK